MSSDANSHPVQNMINLMGSTHPAVQDSLPRLSGELISLIPSSIRLLTKSSLTEIITQNDRLPSESANTTSNKSQRPKFKRSRDGCLTCRKRKVKCDMMTPVCLKCTSLGRECTYPNPNETQNNKRRKVSSPSTSARSVEPPETSSHTERTKQNYQTTYIDPFADPEISLKRLQALLGSKLLAQLIQSAPDVKVESEELALPAIYDSSSQHHLPSVQPITQNTLPVPSTSSAMSVLPSGSSALPPTSFFDPATSRMLPPQLDPAMMNTSTMSTVSVPFSSFNSNLVGTNSPPAFASEYANYVSPPPFFPSPPILNGNTENEYVYNRPSPATSTSSPSSLPPLINDNFQHSNSIINANPQSRQLLHNFLSESKKLLCAINEPKNPFLALSIPLVLNSNQAAITYGILAISATHMHFIRQKQGLEASQELNLSKHLKSMALKQVMMPLLNDAHNNQDVDMSLLAFIAVLKYDVLSASVDWRQSMNVALALVRNLGGPAAMLGLDRNLRLMHNVSKKSLFIRKTFLEELTAHEVFACLTTGETPQLLGDDNQSWWFDMETDEKLNSEHYESFERSYGMSRYMLDIIARSCKLYNQRRNLKIPIPIDESEAESLKGILPVELLNAMQDLRSRTFAMYGELENMTKQSVVIRHQRVECGDLIYRHTLMIFLSREIFNISMQDSSIQSAARAVLGLCSEATREMGMAVMLIWAIIISGVQMYKPEDRDWVQQLFSSCREWYCSDLECAEKIVKECWQRQDKGIANKDWRSVARDLQIDVMML
ncbi:hypothetical protein E3Q19_01882 [Wallemia mellicola]|nr:hypothetical protein E3Q19_01882 [Wallemia mellicola]